MKKGKLDKLTEAQKVVAKGNREETDQEKLSRLKTQAEAEEKAVEDAKKGPYRSFLQMNKELYKQEDWLMKTSPAAYRLLRFISQNMDNYNALICSYAVFAETLGYSRQTISNAIKLLKEKKFITTARTGGSNIYFINKELYWHSYGTNYARAEFGAKIIISADEQETEEKEEIKIKAKKYKSLEVENEEFENVGA